MNRLGVSRYPQGTRVGIPDIRCFQALDPGDDHQERGVPS
jgi:hypothetical protein